VMVAVMFMIEAPRESESGVGFCMLALYLPKSGEGLLTPKQ